jgi:hypothetical protein
MFQFPALALSRLYIQREVMPCYRHCVSTFRNLRINACLPASRSLSQAAASFFASRCQDIHRTPLVSLTSWIEDRSREIALTASILPHKKVYFANRCSSDARSDGKTKKTIFQKQASQKSLILTRTSYLIVKEPSSFDESCAPFGSH